MTRERNLLLCDLAPFKGVQNSAATAPLDSEASAHHEFSTKTMDKGGVADERAVSAFPVNGKRVPVELSGESGPLQSETGVS
jgi:hypothetical protein